MNVIPHMAVSLDGMVARENDDTDFLADDNWVIFVEMAREVGALMWGRRTHELVRGYGASFIDALDGLGRIVVSTNAQLMLEPGWRVATSPEQAVALLDAQGHQRALVVGGAAVNTAFAQAGLIDEVRLNVQSVMVGRGIPLFAPATLDLELQLLAVNQVRAEIVQLHYRVPR